MNSFTSSALVLAAAVLLALTLAQHGSLAATVGPRVIVVGAGMSGKHIYVIHIKQHVCPDDNVDEMMRYFVIYVDTFSGISAAKRLSDAGITDLLILEATDHIGGRMHKKNFAGINVEVGANWVEGVNGGKMNPIWPIVNSTLKLRNFRSDFDYLAQNVYKEEYVDYRELMSSASYSV